MRGSLLIAGTSSDVGKSVLVAGLCRWLARHGVRVAPFKGAEHVEQLRGDPRRRRDRPRAGDAGGACGLEPSVRFNPVLLKPGADNSSQVVVLGKPVGDADALSCRDRRDALRDVVLSTLDDLRAECDVVVCEGAGSPAEINLRDGDIANLGLARAARLPVLVVGDIDRGGVLAHLFGTLAILDPADQAVVAAFAVNKFRGDGALLPGLSRLTGRPVLGVLPWHPDLWLEAEDSLSYPADGMVGRPAPPVGEQWLRVAVIRLSRISNATDIGALACEPGVAVRLVTDPSRLADADLVVLPGTKSTVDDLAWLRRQGLAAALAEHVDAGRPLLAACGGYQMLGHTITDEVESRAGSVAALGLLDQDVTFASAKTLSRPTGTALGETVTGYEIHHGRVTRRGAVPPLIEGAGEESSSVRSPRPTGTACSTTTPSAASSCGGPRATPAAPGSHPRRTSAWRGSATLSWTCSATWWPTTSTPTRSPASSRKAPQPTYRPCTPQLVSEAGEAGDHRVSVQRRPTDTSGAP